MLNLFILQTLNDIYILNDEGILLYHKTYEETTWLVLCNGYLCVSSDDATRIYDFKRACTCFQLQNNDIVQIEKIYACYARIMASNVDRWFYRASIRVGIVSTQTTVSTVPRRALSVHHRHGRSQTHETDPRRMSQPKLLPSTLVQILYRHVQTHRIVSRTPRDPPCLFI